MTKNRGSQRKKVRGVCHSLDVISQLIVLDQCESLNLFKSFMLA